MRDRTFKSLVIIGTGPAGLTLSSHGRQAGHPAVYFYDPEYDGSNFALNNLIRHPIGYLASTHCWIISSDLPEERHAWEERLSIDKVHYTDLVHPTVIGIQPSYRTSGIVALPYVVVEPQVKLAPHVYLSNHSVVKANCVLGAYVCVGDHAVLGQNCHIGQGALIKPGAVLPPNTDVRPWSVYPPEGE